MRDRRGWRRLFQWPDRFPFGDDEELTREVDEELEFHLERRAAELVDQGLSPAAARERARREFGDLDGTRSHARRLAARRARRTRIEAVVDELRLAARSLWRQVRRSPGIAAVTLITLATAIGINTAVFGVVEAALLRPLPYAGPDRLVDVTRTPESRRNRAGGGGGTVPFSLFREWRDRADSFAEIAAYTDRSLVLTGRGTPAKLQGWAVSSNLPGMMGGRVEVGRGFLPEEDRPGPGALVLSYRLWTSRFGGDRSVVGDTVTLSGTAYRVVGVMERGFDFPRVAAQFEMEGGPDYWLSLSALPRSPEEWGHAQGGWWVVGRLVERVTESAAEAELDSILEGTGAAGDPSSLRWVSDVTPLHTYLVGSVGWPLTLMSGAVAVVLLIACVNVANLLLAQALDRRSEMTVRMALGASRGRVALQLVLEAILLALPAGLAGVAATYWALPLVVALAGSELSWAPPVGVNVPVLAGSLAATMLAGLLAGLAPALGVGRARGTEILTPEGSRSATQSASGRRVNDVLVVAEVGLAVILLAGAGLLAHSFLKLVSVEPGFDPDGVAVAKLQLPPYAYPSVDSEMAFARRLHERLAPMPGVEHAAVTTGLPLASGGIGAPRRPGEPVDRSLPWAHYAFVSEGYFDVLRIPRLRGRSLWDSASNRGADHRAVIDTVAAREYFPGTDSLGKSLAVGNADAATIVAVVGATRQRSLMEEPPPHVYFPLEQASNLEWLKVIVRTEGDPAAFTAALRDVIRELDPDLPLREVTTLNGMLADSLDRQRFYTILLSIFAGAGILTAAAGVYGVMRHAVARRVREIGIRMAVGAGEGDILRLVAGRGGGLALLGLILGLVGAAAATRLLSSFLYELSPLDPLTLGCVAGGLLLVAGLASYLPARRAARVDPLEALRTE